MQRKRIPEATQDARAAGYIRVSTDEQAREGMSLGAQRDAIEERAPGARIFEDVLSGGRADRPQYQTMLTAVAGGEFDRLYVWKFDRLGRDAEELLRARRMLAAAGVTIVSLTEGEAESILLYGVHAIMGQVEREKIGERTRTGLREVAKSGRSTGGQPPLGYRSEGQRKDRRWVIDEAEAAIVRKAAALYLDGTGVNRLAATLNAEGRRTRRGAKFSARVVLDLLDNPAYVGLVRLKGETFPGLHKPILDRETWDAIQTLRHARRTFSGGQGRPPARHLLVPLLTCHNGHRMIARTNANGWEHYRCQRRHTYGDCDARAVPRQAVDEAVLAAFTSENLDLAATKASLMEAATAEATNARALADAAAAERGKAAMKLERIRADYVDGRIGADDWRAFRAELEAQGEAAEAEAERLRGQAEQAEAALAAIDAEQELVERLAAVREHVSGRVADAGSVAAVRAALVATFERIVVGRAGDEWAVDGLPEAQPMTVTEGGLVLVPVPRRELLAPTPVPVRLADGSLAEVELQRPPKAALRLAEESGPNARSAHFLAAGHHARSVSVPPVSAALLAALFPAIPVGAASAR